VHLIVPFASAVSGALRAALRELALPHTADLLAAAAQVRSDAGDELSLSPPHERALARALGLGGSDGTHPLAAVLAARDGIATDGHAWALLMPAHWRLGTEQVSLLDPDDLDLDELASRALLEAVRPLFESEGFALRYGAPTRWYAMHPALDGLTCASPDRVIGRNVDRWLWPGVPTAETRRMRRLQNEVQMLLHGHALNEAREAAGRLAVNSFWISGCGAAPALTWPADLVVDERLRRPALRDDARAWCEAWEALDAGPVAAALHAAAAGTATTVTLCGERTAASLALGRRRWLGALRGRWRRPQPAAWLEAL
jgi:hypothetical protein